jgi:hypothetical protein
MISETESQLPNFWVRRVAFFATCVMVAWVCAGWIMSKGLSPEGLMLAAMSGAMQALAWNASAQMHRASAPEQKRARTFWRWTLIVAAAWTAFSAHHAYGVIAQVRPAWPHDFASALEFAHSAAALILLTAWAFIEPLLGWAIEKTERPSASPIAQTVAPVITNEPSAADRRSRPALVATAMTAAAVASVAALPAAAHSQSIDAVRERALHLFSEGERNAAAIARAIGAPASTVRRWVAASRSASGASGAIGRVGANRSQ